MNAHELRELIKEVLSGCLTLEIPYSEDAVELLMLTAAQESLLGTHIVQMGGGPARGIFQMEPATEKDIYENYLAYQPNLRHIVDGYKMAYSDSQGLNLKANLVYQIVMARVHYFRVSEALPDHRELYATAKYWKKYYNTEKGAGDFKDAELNYQLYCL